MTVAKPADSSQDVDSRLLGTGNFGNKVRGAGQLGLKATIAPVALSCHKAIEADGETDMLLHWPKSLDL